MKNKILSLALTLAVGFSGLALGSEKKDKKPWSLKKRVMVATGSTAGLGLAYWATRRKLDLGVMKKDTLEFAAAAVKKTDGVVKKTVFVGLASFVGTFVLWDTISKKVESAEGFVQDAKFAFEQVGMRFWKWPSAFGKSQKEREARKQAEKRRKEVSNETTNEKIVCKEGSVTIIESYVGNIDLKDTYAKTMISGDNEKLIISNHFKKPTTVVTNRLNKKMDDSVFNSFVILKDGKEKLVRDLEC